MVSVTRLFGATPENRSKNNDIEDIPDYKAYYSNDDCENGQQNNNLSKTTEQQLLEKMCHKRL